MPIVIGLLGLIFAAYIWATRIRAAGQMAGELSDMASDVLAAARRFGFRRRLDTHPVDCTDDPHVITGALAIAFLELSGLPTTEAQTATIAALGRHLHRDLDTSRELAILGRWLVHESNGPMQSIARLSKRLFKLSGMAGLAPLMDVLTDVGASGGGALSPRQQDALAEIARVFRVT